MNPQKKKPAAKKGGSNSSKNNKGDVNRSKVNKEAGKKKETVVPPEVEDEDDQIFTSNFFKKHLEQDKEFRQLRKEVLDLKAVNTLMLNHIDKMKKSQQQLIDANEKRLTLNKSLREHNEKLQNAFIEKFADVALPASGIKPTKDNYQEYFQELQAITKDKNHPFFKKAEELIRTIAIE